MNSLQVVILFIVILFVGQLLREKFPMLKSKGVQAAALMLMVIILIISMTTIFTG